MDESKSPDEAATDGDGPLREYSERMGIDFDAVIGVVRKWSVDNPFPKDLGPEPFNVGKPRPPVD